MVQKDKASFENSDVTEILELPEREFKMEIVRKSQKKFRKWKRETGSIFYEVISRQAMAEGSQWTWKCVNTNLSN